MPLPMYRVYPAPMVFPFRHRGLYVTESWGCGVLASSLRRMRIRIHRFRSYIRKHFQLMKSAVTLEWVTIAGRLAFWEDTYGAGSFFRLMHLCPPPNTPS